MNTILSISFIPFDSTVIAWFFLLAVLLFCSAFVSGSEAAYFSLGHKDIDEIERMQSKRSKTALRLLEKQDYLLSTILIINNLINIAAVLVANNIINKIVNFGDSFIAEFVIKTVIVTFILLFFGEIMPKILATQGPRKFAVLVAIPLDIMRSIVKPLSYLLINSSSIISELAARRRANISIEQLSDAIEITSVDTAEDKKILTGIVRFVNTEVSDIMRHRVDIIALDITDSLERVKDIIISSGFSRIPVFEEDLDNIIGVLYVKDMVEFLDLDSNSFKWQTIIRKAYFVPEHKKINDLLKEFQSVQIHFAVIVDEYGSTQGVVSLEDILEEIVGEIADESDLESRLYVKIDDNTFDFDAKTGLTDFQRIFDLDDEFFGKIRSQAESLAGVMLERKRDFLKIGDRIELEPFTFIVTKMDGRRVQTIRVVNK